MNNSKKRRKKRKNKGKSNVVINASNNPNSSIIVATDNGKVNVSHEMPSKLNKILTIIAAIVTITGIPLVSFFNLLDTNDNSYKKKTGVNDTTNITSRTEVKRSSDVKEIRHEYVKDCTVVEIHKGRTDTIIKHIVRQPNGEQNSSEPILYH